MDGICETINKLFEESKKQILENEDINALTMVNVYYEAIVEYKSLHPIEAISSNNILLPYAMAKVRDYIWFGESDYKED